MSEDFFRRPILNSPYNYPTRHWELDSTGQPTQNVATSRRRADFITTPIPKPKKRKTSQGELHLEDEKGLSTANQQHDLKSIINQVRGAVDTWRKLPEGSWAVTPDKGGHSGERDNPKWT
jgi:type III restriction enzyme